MLSNANVFRNSDTQYFCWQFFSPHTITKIPIIRPLPRIPYILTTSGLTTSRQCWGRHFWVNQVYKLTTLLYADKIFDNSFKFWSLLMKNERFLSSPSIFYYYQCRQKYFTLPNGSQVQTSHIMINDKWKIWQLTKCLLLLSMPSEKYPLNLCFADVFFKSSKYQGNPYSYRDNNGVFRKKYIYTTKWFSSHIFLIWSKYRIWLGV